MNAKQKKRFKALAVYGWLMLGENANSLWICKRGVEQKVFSRIDEYGALMGEDRETYMDAFGKKKAVDQVLLAFGEMR